MIIKKLRIVIYVRYSTTNQREESAEAQIRACEEYARKHNMIVVKIYKDLGFSASKDIKKRLEFNQMIEDSKKGEFDAVLVHKIDRFARSQLDYLRNEQKLNENGVELISVGQPFINSKDGKMIKSFLITSAEIFSENLSNEIKTKNFEYAKKGLYLGGVVPYGYQIKVDENDDTKKRYIVNQNEAVIVKKIFELYSIGYSAKQIVNYLYEQGIKDREGKVFQISKLWRMLKNEIYIGTYSYNKKNNDETTVIIPNNHEAIISKNVWERVHNNLKAKQHKARARKGDKPKYVLTGIIKCGCCGYSFGGRGGNKGYRYYKCGSLLNKHKGYCENNLSLNKDRIESRISKLVVEKLFTEDAVQIYAEQIFKSIKVDKDAELKMKQLKVNKTKLENKIEKLFELYLDGMFDKAKLKIKETEIQNEIDIIEQKIYEHEVINKTVTKEEILNQLNQIKNELQNSSSELLEYILKLAIDSIIVHKDSIDIYFNLFNPYPLKDTGIISNHILANPTLGLPIIALTQQGVDIYKLKNGMYFGLISISKY